MAITVFSWGYKGWGNATEQFIEATANIEQARGYERPFFVDIRFRHSVRAQGFRGDAFGHTAGEGFYKQIRDLGNEGIMGGRKKIHKPEAVEELLDDVRNAWSRKQRVLFFCSCQSPRRSDGIICHRVDVTKLLLDAARRQNIDLQVVEWPGGEPTVIELEVAASPAAVAERAAIPLESADLGLELAGLPWYSVVLVRKGKEMQPVISGPAKVYSGIWQLPILSAPNGRASNLTRVIERGRKLHKQHACDPRRSRRSGTSKPTTLASYSIYTIAHPDKLGDFVDDAGYGVLTEQKVWTKARQLLADSRREGTLLPILFADSTDCSRLIYQARLINIGLQRGSTQFSFVGLKRLPKGHRPQELRLLSTSRNIAPDYIRPYAICHTPAWLEG